MYSIAAQNIHQATPGVLAIMAAEGVKVGDDLMLPVPLTVILFHPHQRVNAWPQLNLCPHRVFLAGLLTLAPYKIDFVDDVHTKSGGLLADDLTRIVDQLRRDRFSSVALPAPFGAPVTHAHLALNIEGALDLFLATVDADLVSDVLGIDPVRYSLVQQLVAEAVGVPMGVLYQVASAVRLPGPQAGLLDLPTEDVMPCPYSFDHSPEVIVGPQQILGLPLGRWRRELSTLLKHGPAGPVGGDHWLEGVARPLWGSWQAWKRTAGDRAVRAVEAQGALQGLSDLPWLQAAWHWLESRRGPE